ncbi:DUF4249 domain-containing protein [Crocinitomicaceae bacterium]|nr:DUF4249 domain-containing protein [Crocinitomicaceae bacterium]MDC1202840.1 DUF4249 domain-containing protein [Crocinitomicaceae bacterium]
MKNLLPIFLILSALTLSNCTKEIEFDAQDIAPRIVVNSLFTNDSIWSAHISRSVGVLETTSYTTIDNASVNIFDDNANLVTTLTHQGDGLYTSPTGVSPQPNQSYTLEASASGYESVNATNSIPSAVPIYQLDTVTSTNNDGETILEATITFQDPPNVSNYYMLEVFVTGMYYDEWEQDSIEIREPLQISCDDINVETVNRFNFGGFENTYLYLMLKDQNFDGENYALTFTVINYAELKDMDLFGEIRLVNTSEEYFNYLKSFNMYQRTINNPFATPVQVYSNVNNGMGIFAGGTLTSWTVQF